MHYECVKSDTAKDEWIVEAIDYQSEGEIYMTLFVGLKAEERAKEYTAWQNERRGSVGTPA